MTIDDVELLREFVVESQEHLSDVENQLLTLESQGEDMDVALVNTVFRAVHSIKGAAGFLGLETLQGLAHREEEVLNKLRNHELRPTSEVINTLLKATDRLKGLLDSIDSSNSEDVSEHLTALERILNGESPTPEAAPAPAATEASKEPASSGVSKEALREFLIESYENLELFERDLMSLERNASSEELINSVFRTVHTIKGTAGFLGFTKLEKITHVGENILGCVRAGQFKLDDDICAAMFALVDAIRKLLASIETTGAEGNDDFAVLARYLSELQEIKLKGSKPVSDSKKSDAASTTKAPTEKPVAAPSPTTTASTPAVASETVASSAPAAPNKPAPVKAPPSTSNNSSTNSSSSEASAADSSIRVDVALLDKLMTRVGELVLARNQIMQFNSTLADSALQGATQRLNLITTELQEGVMKTRMQPIGNVWSKFPRLVRDLASICEKQVRIEMEGKETELDKTIIEAIKDPLTHLVRNTVDHGIEKPEVRLEKGKPAEGCLTLKAYHEGGQVNIEIVDDGAGLNLERIKAKAVEKNLISADQAARMPDREVGQLIFLPGFSTAEKVSNVSGRGVGMDVVKTNIEKIGGTVDLQSQPGQGTTIKIKIPLTLAIIPALIVTSDNDRYAIPQVNLLELVRLDGEQASQGIELFQGTPVYRLRGRLLPLVYLRNELGLPAATEDLDVTNIVVLRADDRQFGLVVDRINDSEEIVVKPLSKQLKGVSVYAGTTIMGDGRVALILDVMGLAHSAHVISGVRDRTLSEVADRSHTNRHALQTLLVLAVGQDRRFALPIDQVTRLEKISVEAVEHTGDREVVQYRGEILPLIRLSQTLGVPSVMHDANLMDVVVYSEQGNSIGLVVDAIVDIVETEVSSTKVSNQLGLHGSAVIQGQVTDLLDLPAVIRMVDPSFFHEVSNA